MEFTFGSPETLIGQITDDSYIAQKFVASSDRIKSVQIRFATYKRVNICSISVKLLSMDGAILGHSLANCAILQDNQFHEFVFNSKVEAGNFYQIKLEFKRCSPDNFVTLRYGKSKNTASSLIINGENIRDKELDCRLIYEDRVKSEVSDVNKISSPYLDKFHDNGIVSIIVLNKDRPDLLERCINGLKNIKYDKIEVIFGDTGSKDSSVFELYDSCPFKTKVLRNLKYNFSTNNNDLAKEAAGDTLLFMNNDVFLTEDSVTKCLKYMRCRKVGSVGIRLISPNGRIDHDGQSLLTGDLLLTPDHVNINRFPHAVPDGNAIVNGNTGAFLMTPKSLFLSLGGFSDEYPDIYQDCDYAMKVMQHGLLNFCVRKTSAIHVGSATRGSNTSKISTNRDFGTYKGKWEKAVPSVSSPKFSFITCVNKPEIYYNMILSLDFRGKKISELLPFDNTDNFLTVTEALNVCRELCIGEFIIYCHQDLLFSPNWCGNVLKSINSLDIERVGIMGFEGIGHAPGLIPVSHHKTPVGNAIEIQTLDELCLITPKKDLVFDEKQKFHFYGADICLQANKKGLSNYILCGAETIHLSGGGENVMADKNGFKAEANILWKKWKKDYPFFMTTTTIFMNKKIQYMICAEHLNTNGD